MPAKKTAKPKLKKPDVPVPVRLSLTEKQALTSILAEVARTDEILQQKIATREGVVKEVLAAHGFDPDCWLDVTNVQHGVIRVSEEDPHTSQ